MKKLCILLLLACSFSVYAQNREPIGIDFFTKVKSFSNLKERDGKIFFVLRQPNLESDGYDSDLYQLVGGEVVRLTSSKNVSDYFFLNDAIVFQNIREEEDRSARRKGEELTVYQMLTVGYQEAVEWKRLPYSVREIKLIDENRFFFTATYKVNEELNDGDGGRYRIFDELPFWSNGRGDVSGQRTLLYYYDNGHIRPLSDTLDMVSGLELSPDNRHLIYTHKSYKSKSPQNNRLISLDTKSLEKKEWDPVNNASYSQAQFISNNELILLVSRNLEIGQENSRIYKLDIHTGNNQEIYDCEIYSVGNSIGSDVKGSGRNRMSADKDGVRYISTVVDQAPLIHVNYKDSKNRITFLSPEKISISDYLPYKDGFLATAMLEQQGDELYFIDKKGVLSPLTSVNRDIFAKHRVIAPVEIKFTNEAGMELNGYVLPPVNYEKGKKYPTILDIHGGPKTAYGTVFFHEMQYWANLGYAVIYTNPRGSSGRGNEFADLCGKYGSIDYSDLMAFTDAAIAQADFIDERRMGVTGGSYGGFMTNWIIGHTDRFKAAASQRSIASWISFSNTADIGHTFIKSNIGANVWENSQLLWDQSPLKYADRVKTPTLFIHSDQDYRCWLVEGLQMYYALQYFEVPSRIVIFEGENHELSRSGKPKNRIKRLAEITRWFEKYL